MVFFFFNDTATTEIYTLSLHDALPISAMRAVVYRRPFEVAVEEVPDPRIEQPNDVIVRVTSTCICGADLYLDRKSTRLNSSHANISYAVFCLKKKKILMIYIVPSRNHS